MKPSAVWVALEGSPEGADPLIYEVAALVVDPSFAWQPGASLSLPVRQAQGDWVDQIKEADPGLAERYRRNGLIKAVRSAPLARSQIDQALADLVRHEGLRLIVQDRAAYDLLSHRQAGMGRKFFRALGAAAVEPIFMADFWFAIQGAAPWWQRSHRSRKHRAMDDLTKDCLTAADIIERLSDDSD